MKKIFTPIFLFCLFFPVTVSLAQNSTTDKENLQDAFGSPFVNLAKRAGYNVYQSDFTTILSTIISVLLSLIGVIFIVLIIYGGIIWMTATGNEEQAKKAGNIIKQSSIGLIIVIVAYAFSYLLITLFGGQLVGTP